MRRALMALAIALLAANSGMAGQNAFVIAPQPLEEDNTAAAYDVSADGRRVVGTSGSQSAPGMHVVLWDDLGAPVAIGPTWLLPPDELRISADGSTVTGHFLGGGRFGPPEKSFRWDAIAGFVEIPLGVTRGISPDGSINYGSIFSNTIAGNVAARWIAGVESIFAPLGYPAGLPGSLAAETAEGVVIGWADGPSARVAFASDGTTLAPLPTPVGYSTDCRPSSVSADGSTVVGVCYPAGVLWNPRAVRWSSRDVPEFEELEVATDGYALDVSANGNGQSGDQNTQEWTAFVWRPDTGARAVSEVLESGGVDATGFAFRFATGISADGWTVVGPTSSRCCR